MRVRLKGINSKRKRLADGSTKTYYYAWKGGPRLRGEPGTPEFIASYNEAVAARVAPPSGVLLALLFQFQDSAEFQFGISPRTRRDYIKQIIPSLIDQNLYAHWRNPIDMMRQGWSTSLFQA